MARASDQARWIACQPCTAAIASTLGAARPDLVWQISMSTDLRPRPHPAAGRLPAGTLTSGRPSSELLPRIAASDDDKVWISRVPDACCRPRSRSRGHPAPSAARSGACPSRSRTISTSPACRPPPPARASPTRPETRPTVVERLVAAGAIVDRQDQPRPVRDRPGRRALALWRGAQSVRSGLHPGRLELRLGGRRRRPGW